MVSLTKDFYRASLYWIDGMNGLISQDNFAIVWTSVDVKMLKIYLSGLRQQPAKVRVEGLLMLLLILSSQAMAMLSF